MIDVTMVMVVVALTVKDEDEREGKKRTVAAQGVVHKGMMMGHESPRNRTQDTIRHDTLQQRGDWSRVLREVKRINSK
jgi:hypothetical protein